MEKENFIHLMCQVLNDLKIIDERLKKYKIERANLEEIKSNEADYDTLQREINSEGWKNMFINRRYLFAQVSEYYDADFDYATAVKISQLPAVKMIDGPALEKKFLEMHRDNQEQYYYEIKKLIEQKKLLENLKELIEQNYYLHKRQEIFMDIAYLYEEKHYQSFVVLGMLQLEGLFFDMCSIKYDDKENADSLVEKAEKALGGKNEISYMRYYPYFAFDVPVKRNEIAHTGLIKSQNLEQLANEVLLDLNAVAQMAKIESDGKFRIFMIIYQHLLEVDSSDEKVLNKRLVFELLACKNISSDFFGEVLKDLNQFEKEIEFYKQNDILEGYADLPTIVKEISGMIYQLPFWCEMVNTLNEHDENDEINQFLINMAKNYVKVLNNGCKNKCIEILTALK